MSFFKELRSKDPQKYQQLEQKAIRCGYINSSQTLADLDCEEKYKWLQNWAKSELLGVQPNGLYKASFRASGQLTPGQIQTAEIIAAYANGVRRDTLTAEDTVLTKETSNERETVAASIAELANKYRR